MTEFIPKIRKLEIPDVKGPIVPNPKPVTLPKPVAGVHLPEVVLYEHVDFGGAEWRTNLSYSYVGSDWNDRVSSIIVVSGTWQFFVDVDFGGASVTLGPGYYRFVQDVGLPNDSLSSFKAISA
jgi:hypothetical protein